MVKINNSLKAFFLQSSLKLLSYNNDYGLYFHPVVVMGLISTYSLHKKNVEEGGELSFNFTPGYYQYKQLLWK